MITDEITVRVRYGEVDKMGFLYHSHYIEYYDMGRNELIRGTGVTQIELEEQEGVLIPVLNVDITYITPANFDDVLTIKTTIESMPTAKAVFKGEIYKDGVLINHSTITLAFIDAVTKRAVRPPQRLLQALESRMMIKK